MKRRSFLKKTSLATAGMMTVPYILPSGRLFAATGSRLANHVVFVLFAGGIRNQESIQQRYLADQGLPTQGNVMENILTGQRPTSNLVHNRWQPILSNPLQKRGTLFKEVEYKSGPTGHYNGHTVAITGNYTTTSLNLNINPESPTIFEYYRKHTDPAKSALNAWWLSEGLGPYPSLNYSRHPQYGPLYGANYLRPATTFSDLGQAFLSDAKSYQPDDVARIAKVKQFLDDNFPKEATDLPGVKNNPEDKEEVKKFIKDVVDGNIQMEWPTPNGSPVGLTSDLVNIAAGWQVLKAFKPELMVLNTFNLDICHYDFTLYLQFLHQADYGVGWLWNKIQSDPVLKDDTIMICMPEHGRNQDPNSIYDSNGLLAYDHTSDDNSRRCFALIVGPSGVVRQNVTEGSQNNPVGETIDIVPTIAHVLGFNDQIPGNLLNGRALTEAFV